MAKAINDSVILEINCKRLLAQCKKLAQTKTKDNHWRFERYVSKFEELLKTLEDVRGEVTCSSSPDVIPTFKEESAFLNGLLAAAQKESSEQKVVHCQSLSVPSLSNEDASSSSMQGNTQLRQIKMHSVSLYSADMRRELLGSDDGTLRLRGVGGAGLQPGDGNADMDLLISHHNKIQEKLADDFLELTRSLKENIKVAGHVVKDDTKTVERVDKQAEANRIQLEKEAKRLEKYAYGGCDWWIYVMIFIVFVTFIGMVLFMRLFTKHQWLG